jgi:hypothetical protein
MVRSHLATYKVALITEEDFEQAAKDVATLEKAINSLKDVKEASLKDAKPLHALYQQLDGLTEELSSVKGILKNQRDKYNELKKNDIIEDFLGQFEEAGVDPRDARLKFRGGLQEAIKGKRNSDSRRLACRQYVEPLLSAIRVNREKLDKFVAKFGEDLVMDRRSLELMTEESLRAEMDRRIVAKENAMRLAAIKAEADAAKAEAAKAKEALTESAKLPSPSKPAARIIEDDAPWSALHTAKPKPTGRVSTWNRLKGVCLSAFSTMKAAKKEVEDPEILEAFDEFAMAVNAAWSVLLTKIASKLSGEEVAQ